MLGHFLIVAWLIFKGSSAFFLDSGFSAISDCPVCFCTRKYTLYEKVKKIKNPLKGVLNMHPLGLRTV